MPREAFLFNIEKQQYIHSIDIFHFITDSLVDYEQVENFNLLTIGGNVVLLS